MYSKVQTANKIIRMIYQFLLIVLSINVCLVLIYFPTLTAWEMIFIAVMLMVSYFFRDKFSRAFMLLLVHMVLTVILVFTLPNMAPKIMIFIASFIVMMDGVYYMKRAFTLKRMFDVPWEAFAVGIIALITDHYFNVPLIRTQGLVFTTIMVFLYIITFYLEGLQEYIVSSRTLTRFPIKQIVSVNTIIVSGIMLIAVVVVVLAELLGLDALLLRFFKMLLYLLRILIMVILFALRFFFSFFGYDNTGNPDTVQQAMPEIEENESIFMDILEFIVIAFVIAVAVFFLILLIKYLVRLFLSRRSSIYDLTENLSGFKEKSVTKERIKREKTFGRLDPVMRARRIYKKKIESFARFFRPDRYSTTGDIEERLAFAQIEKERAKELIMGNHGSEAADGDADNYATEETLRELYENVRYGNTVPDRAYLKKMKKA